MKNFILCLVLFITTHVHAQFRTYIDYGGYGAIDRNISCLADAAGDLIAVGNFNYIVDDDYFAHGLWIGKMNVSAGDETFNTRRMISFPDLDPDYEIEPISMIIDADNNAVICGYIYKTDDPPTTYVKYFGFILKFNLGTWNTDWFSLADETAANNYSKFLDVIQKTTSPYNYIVAGESYTGTSKPDASTWEVANSTGIITNMKKTYSLPSGTTTAPPYYDSYTAIELVGGYYYTAGTFQLNSTLGYNKPGQMKLSSSGVVSTFTYYIANGSATSNLYATDMVYSDGYFYTIVGGDYSSSANYKTPFLIKTDAAGVPAFIKKYGKNVIGSTVVPFVPYAVKILPDGNVLMICSDYSSGVMANIVLLKVSSSDGSLIWNVYDNTGLSSLDPAPTFRNEFKKGSVVIIGDKIYIGGKYSNEATLLCVETSDGRVDDCEVFNTYSLLTQDFTYYDDTWNKNSKANSDVFIMQETTSNSKDFNYTDCEYPERGANDQNTVGEKFYLSYENANIYLHAVENSQNIRDYQFCIYSELGVVLSKGMLCNGENVKLDFHGYSGYFSIKLDAISASDTEVLKGMKYR